MDNKEIEYKLANLYSELENFKKLPMRFIVGAFLTSGSVGGTLLYNAMSTYINVQENKVDILAIEKKLASGHSRAYTTVKVLEEKVNTLKVRVDKIDRRVK